MRLHPCLAASRRGSGADQNGLRFDHNFLDEVVQVAYTDEAGHAFQYEAGHLFRSEVGHRTDLKPATLDEAHAGRMG
jgi:hypothetical protein